MSPTLLRLRNESRAATPEAIDAGLVAAALDGDHDAANQLYTRHVDVVSAICRRRLRDPHDAADAAQEAFTRALARLDHLNDRERFGPWVRTIAINVCRDARRRQPTREFDESYLAPSDGADVEVLARSDAADVHRRLATLSERDARALWLRDAVDVPIHAIAADLGLTEGSTRVMLTRARSRMRAAYGAMTAPVFAFFDAARARSARMTASAWEPALYAATTAAVAVAVAIAPYAAHDPQRLDLANLESSTTTADGDLLSAADRTAAVDNAASDQVAVRSSARANHPGSTADRGDASGRPHTPVAVMGERPSEEPGASVSASDGDDELALLLFTGELLDDPIDGPGGIVLVRP